MQKFSEVCLLILVIVMLYIVFRAESFVQSVSDTAKSRKFNFSNDAYGYSAADKLLQAKLNGN